MAKSTSFTLIEAAQDYLESVSLSRSENTARTYTNAMRSFLESWIKRGGDPEEDRVRLLAEDFIAAKEYPAPPGNARQSG